MSGSEEESVRTPDALKGDPNTNRLMARLLDKMDCVLFSHGLVFRAEEDWNDFIIELSALVFRFYDDETGGDGDYDPNNAPDSTSTTETVSEEEVDLEQETSDDTATATRTVKKPKTK